jgi:hypothetical protein
MFGGADLEPVASLLAFSGEFCWADAAPPKWALDTEISKQISRAADLKSLIAQRGMILPCGIGWSPLAKRGGKTHFRFFCPVPKMLLGRAPEKAA